MKSIWLVACTLLLSYYISTSICVVAAVVHADITKIAV